MRSLPRRLSYFLSEELEREVGTLRLDSTDALLQSERGNLSSNLIQPNEFLTGGVRLDDNNALGERCASSIPSLLQRVAAVNRPAFG